MLTLQSTRGLRTCIHSLPRHALAYAPRRHRLRHARSQLGGDPAHHISFQEQLARSAGDKPFLGALGRPSIKNQILFFFGGSALIFTWAAWKTNEDTAIWFKKVEDMSNVFGRRGSSGDEMRRAKFLELRMELTNWAAKIAQAPLLPGALKSLLLAAYTSIAQQYLDATEGRRMCYKIAAINTAVWLLWKFPSTRPGMMNRFTHHPLSGLSYTLLTSMFSHQSFLHLFFNTVAMVSFGSAATHWLAKQQSNSPTRLPESTAKYHFLAFFVSAGLFSGLTSHMVSAWFRYPRMVKQLIQARSPSTASALAVAGTRSKTKEAATNILPSLGASGAIYSSVVLSALAFPDLHIALTIPPSFPIPIQYGVGGMVLIDCIGVLRGWRLFDHYAHLGGALYGAAYYMYGGKLWDFLRLGVGGAQTKG